MRNYTKITFARKCFALICIVALTFPLYGFTAVYNTDDNVVTPKYNSYSGEIGYIVVKGETRNQIEAVTTDIVESSRAEAVRKFAREKGKHADETSEEIKAREKELAALKEKDRRKKLIKLAEEREAEQTRKEHHEKFIRQLKEAKAKYHKAERDAQDNSENTYIYSSDWNGEKLTPSRGSITGPSGKETYYNLNMSLVVTYMRAMGFDAINYPYHVREDGVKCLGPYVMVAADLGLRPRGSYVKTSLGTGLVCDTGTFAKTNRTQIDIAVDW
jgi:hypothetical protein